MYKEIGWELSEEKDLNQIGSDETVSENGFDNLDNFVELDDLQNIEGLDDLSGLGDLSDLDEQMPSIGEEASRTDAGETDDILLDTLDIPGLEDIADTDTEEPAALENSIQEDSIQESSNGDEEIDSVLENLLDSLDINGSIDVPEDEESASVMESADSEVAADSDTGASDDSGTDTLDTLEILEDEEINTPSEAVTEQKPEAGIDVPAPDELDIGNIEPEENDDASDASIDGMLDDLMIAHNPDFMDALGLDVNGEEKSQRDEQDEDERKKSKEKQRKRLKKEKQQLEQEEGEKAKRPGFFKRLFGNVVTEEIAQAEQQAKLDEEEKARIKAEEKAKEQQEKQAKKELKAEEKNVKKEQKAARKAQKAEEKAAKKAEKAAKKAEQKELEEKEVVGKLNKAGVTIVVIGAVMILASVIVGTNIFGYRLTKSESEKYFQLKKYSDAYKEAMGSKLKDKEPDEYEKIITVMKVQQSLNTYSSYTAMKYYPDALNALLRGLQKYDENIEKARDLEVDGDLKECRKKILSILKDEFGLSEAQAYAILRLDNENYTKRVVGIAKKKI